MASQPTTPTLVEPSPQNTLSEDSTSPSSSPGTDPTLIAIPELSESHSSDEDVVTDATVPDADKPHVQIAEPQPTPAEHLSLCRKLLAAFLHGAQPTLSPLERASFLWLMEEFRSELIKHLRFEPSRRTFQMVLDALDKVGLPRVPAPDGNTGIVLWYENLELAIVDTGVEGRDRLLLEDEEDDFEVDTAYFADSSEGGEQSSEAVGGVLLH